MKLAHAAILVLLSACTGSKSAPLDTAPAKAAPAASLGPVREARVLHEPAAPRLRHGIAAKQLALSPDGSLVASSGYDETIRIWDTATGEQRAAFAPYLTLSEVALESSTLGRILERSAVDGKVPFVAADELRFSADGSCVVAGKELYGMVSWCLADGSFQLRKALPSPKISFSANGRFLASVEDLASGASQVQVALYGTTDGSSAGAFELDSRPEALAVSDDARHVIVAHRTGFALYTRGRLAKREERAAIGHVVALDANHGLVVTQLGKRLEVTDLLKGKRYTSELTSGAYGPGALAPGGKTLWTVQNQFVSRWHFHTQATPEPAGELPDVVGALTLSGDGRRLALSSRGNIVLWSSDGNPPARASAKGPAPATQLAYNDRGELIVVSAERVSIQASAGEPPRCTFALPKSNIASQRGDTLALGLGGKELVIVDMKGCRELMRAAENTFRVMLSPDAASVHVLTKEACRTLRIPDGSVLHSVTIPREQERGHMPSFTTEFRALSPLGDALLHVSEAGITQLALDGSARERKIHAAAEPMQALVLPAAREPLHGNVFPLVRATVIDKESAKTTVELWDLAEGKQLWRESLSAKGLTLSSQGGLFAAIDETSGAIQLHDIKSAARMLTVPKSESGYRALAVAPDGSRLAALQHDGGIMEFALLR